MGSKLGPNWAAAEVASTTNLSKAAGAVRNKEMLVIVVATAALKRTSVQVSIITCCGGGDAVDGAMESSDGTANFEKATGRRIPKRRRAIDRPRPPAI
jgi:hypothetical protein